MDRTHFFISGHVGSFEPSLPLTANVAQAYQNTLQSDRCDKRPYSQREAIGLRSTIGGLEVLPFQCECCTNFEGDFFWHVTYRKISAA
jgi:hypothetical protein